MKCVDMLSPLRGVRGACEAFVAFATLLGASLRPFAVATAACASVAVDTAPTASPLAAAPSWLLRDCRFDSRLLRLLLLPPAPPPPPAPPGVPPSCPCEDRCPLLPLPLNLGE